MVASIEMVAWIDDDKHDIKKMDIFPVDRAYWADDGLVYGRAGG